MKDFTVLKKGADRTLVKAPFKYYMAIPNEEFRENDQYLWNLPGADAYVVDVDNLLVNLFK